MSFLVVAFLSSRASFSTIFVGNCGIGESFVSTTCFRLWLLVGKGFPL